MADQRRRRRASLDVRQGSRCSRAKVASTMEPFEVRKLTVQIFTIGRIA